jgi:hypothetical protein
MVEIQNGVYGIKTSGEILGLRDEIGKIQTAIADFETGQKLNVAIIAEPLGGKTTLINEIEKLNINRTTKIAFTEIVQDKEKILLPDNAKRIVLLDNCHFLYMRKPEGFGIFYEFLDMVSSQNRIFVTTWNIYSWKFLDEAFGLGKYFPIQILIPALEKENVLLMTLNRYREGEIIFDNGIESEEVPAFYVSEYPFDIAPLGKRIVIPIPKINISYFKKLLLGDKKEKKEEEETAEHRVFEKIYLESKGNPGIALRVWELGLDYPHISPESIGQFFYDIELEHEEAFVLCLILSYQGLKKTEIAEIIDSALRADEIIFRLLNRELIFEGEDNSFRIRPEALRSVIEYLERLRLVW